MNRYLGLGRHFCSRMNIEKYISHTLSLQGACKMLSKGAVYAFVTMLPSSSCTGHRAFPLPQRRKEMSHARRLCCHYQPMATDVTHNAPKLVGVTLQGIDTRNGRYYPGIPCLLYGL